MSRLVRSVDRDGRVSANSIVNFIVSSGTPSWGLSSSVSMWSVTDCTFHVVEYRGCGGRSWNTPFSSRETMGCEPTWWPSTFSWTDEIADL